MPDRTQIEDVLQESFYRILRSGRSFDRAEDALRYVRRIVVNTTIDHYRKRRRNNAHVPLDANSAQSGTSLVSQLDDPLHQLINRERRRLNQLIVDEVKHLLPEMKPEQREAIELVLRAGDRPVKDLCRDAGIPYTTVRSRLQAGLSRIRRRLRARGLLHTEGGRNELP